jgi:hypothetical protein
VSGTDGGTTTYVAGTGCAVVCWGTVCCGVEASFGAGASFGVVCAFGAVGRVGRFRTEAYVGAGALGNGAVGSLGLVGSFGAEACFGDGASGSGAVCCESPGNGDVVSCDGTLRGEVRGAALGGGIG